MPSWKKLISSGSSAVLSSLTLDSPLAVAQGGTGATSLTNLITLTTHTSGNYMIDLSAGALIDITHTPAEGSTGTIAVDLSELTDGTADVVGSADELVYLDAGTQKRKQIDEIKLGQFNNDQSWSATTGTVTSVATAGTVNGVTLTGGAITSTGTVTLGGTLAINNGDWSGTDLAVEHGGTGASTLTSGYALLGNGTSAPQMINSTADSTMLVGNGSTMVAESGATLRTSIGVGTGDSPHFATVEVGDASDTTLDRASAGVLSVEGNRIFHAGGVDVPVADGGTGASTFTDGGVLLGSGTGAITATAVLTNGQLLIGDNSTDPTVATLTGTSNQVTVTNGGGSITLSTPQSIDAGADVTFGTIRVDDATVASSKTTGALIVDGGVGVALDVHAGGDVVAYASSDERLKDNLQVIKGSLDKIGEINGYEFDWNDKSPEWAQKRGHDIGVVAQEVQKVLPEIVMERTNGYLGVDYKRLIPLLIESIKELKQEVEDLKKKVN